MSIVDRAALESSPLADLHAMASELSIDGYRRLRRPELIDAIVSRQGGMDADAAANELQDEESGGRRRRRGRRGGRGRASAREEQEDAREPSDDGERREER